MRVLLIDFDSKIPNVALMQISAYLKAQGHEVAFNISNPDEIWLSCIFKKNRSLALGIRKMYPNIPVRIGGSGISNEWLSEDMQKVKPDYDLYPSTYSQGFTTRGCIRKCKFCIVPRKEGEFRIWQHPKEFHDPRFDSIMIMDNNWLANRDWFFETSDWIIDNDLILREHGMDIRLLDIDIAKQLRRLKLGHSPLHFAFDNIYDEKAVLKGIEILKRTGFNLKQEIEFYILAGFNTTFDEDLYRCNVLKNLGTNAFVMVYKPNKKLKDLVRWANRKWIFWSCDFDDYKKFSSEGIRRDLSRLNEPDESPGVVRSSPESHLPGVIERTSKESISMRAHVSG